MGTAQFGFDYGITNKNGKVPLQKVGCILKKAQEWGIKILDTAYVYGESEAVIGHLLKKNKLFFEVISKFPPIDSSDSLKNLLNKSLKRLHKKRLYAYLVHDFNHFKQNFWIWSTLETFKEYGLVARIGVSLYFPEEWFWLKERGFIPDLVQFPFNLFDRRFEPILKEMKDKGVELHARSIFLQGLAFAKLEEFPSQLVLLKEKLKSVESFCKYYSLSELELWLNFPTSYEEIDAIVVGVTKLKELEEVVKVFKNTGSMKFDFLKDLVVEESLLLPFNWPKNLKIATKERKN